MTSALSTTFRLRAEARLKNARLVEARERTGLTQAAFAAKIGIPYHVYNGYETMRAYPTSAHAGLLADIAGCEVEELFPDVLRRVALERLPRTAVSTAEIEPERLLTAAPRELGALPPPAAETPEDLFIQAELAAAIRSSLDGASRRSRDAVIRHYGLEGRPPETLEAIGERYGVTPERIRKDIWKAVEHVRRDLLRKRVIKREDVAPAAFDASKASGPAINLRWVRYRAEEAAEHRCTDGPCTPHYRIGGVLVPRPERVPTEGVFDGIFCSACGVEIRILHKLTVGRIDFRACARDGAAGRRKARQLFQRITTSWHDPMRFYGVTDFEAAFKRLKKEAISEARNAKTGP